MIRCGLLILALVAGVLTVPGCDKGTKAPATPKPQATATTASQSAGGAAPDKRVGATEAPSGRVADEPVAFRAEDGITVRGHLYASAGPRRQAVILSHVHGGDQTAWRDFARELASDGIAALTFDFRGHGETGGAQDVTHVDRDLAAALLFMQSRDYAQIYLIGASLGGMASIRVAAALDTAGVVTVSAPVSYMGLDVQADIPRVAERKLFLASRDETLGGPQDVQQYMQLAQGPKESFLFEGAAHGTDLFQGPNAAAFKERLIAFVRGQ